MPVHSLKFALQSNCKPRFIGKNLIKQLLHCVVKWFGLLFLLSIAHSMKTVSAGLQYKHRWFLRSAETSFLHKKTRTTSLHNRLEWLRIKIKFTCTVYAQTRTSYTEASLLTWKLSSNKVTWAPEKVIMSAAGLQTKNSGLKTHFL